MRKLISFLFTSLDGVVEAPENYVREELYEDIPALVDEIIAEQDAALLGRKMYQEWSEFWPASDIQPFAGFINNVPKFVASQSLATADWDGSTILSGPLDKEIAKLKRSEGGTIGVHGSISLVRSLLVAGLLDELRFIQVPAFAGRGRRLLTDEDEAVQLDLISAKSTPTGLHYLVYRLHRA